MGRKQTIRNFSRFYVLLNQFPHTGNIEETKCLLVAGVTFGDTTDLKLLTKAEYKTLCENMQFTINSGKSTSNTADSNRWRKRVLASVGGWLKMIGYPQSTTAYVKRITVQAAGSEYDDFNRIPVKRLQELYNAFLDRQNAIRRVEKMEGKMVKLSTGEFALLKAAGIELKINVRATGEC